jgi:hypothetical protein
MDTDKQDKKPVVGIIKEALDKKTKDLGLAAALHAEGCKLIDVDKSDRTRQEFVFEGGEHANDVERRWWQGDCIGSYSVYYSSLRQMKSIIHN